MYHPNNTRNIILLFSNGAHLLLHDIKQLKKTGNWYNNEVLHEKKKNLKSCTSNIPEYLFAKKKAIEEGRKMYTYKFVNLVSGFTYLTTIYSYLTNSSFRIDNFKEISFETIRKNLFLNA